MEKRQCKICGNVWIRSRLRIKVNRRIQIRIRTETTANTKNQCSRSGSTCFWASRIRILLSSSKNSKQHLDSYCFVTSFGLFIFEKLCKCKFKR
jgi:hypothetical protein